MTSFEFSTDPHILKTVIKLMYNIDYYGYFTVSKNGLAGSCANGSNGMTFRINTELTTFKNKTTMVLLTPDISKLLKKVAKADKLTLSDTIDEFVITSSRKQMLVVSKLRKLHSQFVYNKFNNDVYHTTVTVDSKNFFTGLVRIEGCDIVNIKQKGAGVIIEMCVDKITQSVTKLGDCADDQINFESNYSLNKLLKLDGIQHVSSVLKLCFCNGYPLQITAPTNLGEIVHYIKPTE